MLEGHTHTKRRRRRGEDRIDENRREKCGLVKSKVFSKKRYRYKKKNNRLKGRRKSSMTEAPAGVFSPVALNHQLKKKVGDSTSRLSKSTREGALLCYTAHGFFFFFSGRSQPRSIFSPTSSIPAVVPYPFLLHTHTHTHRERHTL